MIWQPQHKKQNLLFSLHSTPSPMSLAGHSSHRTEVQVLIVNHVSFMEVPWKVRLVKDIHGCVSDFYL